ncbi:MAG: hypothetical protein IPJ19_14030 [Planctomycetes bacterium]|nr:hypothetical protein [Planctomycetota bacterium]
MKLHSLTLAATLVLSSLASAQNSTFCFGNGSSGPCPCANTGINGRGCNNSAATGGGELNFHGATNPDTIKLSGSAVIPGALSVFLQGDAQLSSAAVFGDGIRCVGGTLKRLYIRNADSAGSVEAPQVNDGDPSITQRSAALGDTITQGSTRYYQVYYRDPNPSFCAAPQGGTFNVTNGVILNW